MKRGIRHNSKWKKYQPWMAKLRQERSLLSKGWYSTMVVKKVNYAHKSITFRRVLHAPEPGPAQQSPPLDR